MKKEKIVEKVCDAIKTGDIALEVKELIDEVQAWKIKRQALVNELLDCIPSLKNK